MSENSSALSEPTPQGDISQQALPANLDVVTAAVVSKKFRVIVAGSRVFRDRELLFRTLDKLLAKRGSEVIILSGCCCGADSLGEEYAFEHGYRVERHPADWVGLGRRAGPTRNVLMVEVADALVAFRPKEGDSRGTDDVIARARAKGIPVRVVTY